MLMIMDLQGWGGIHNHSSPGSTASLCTFASTEKKKKVWNGEEKKDNWIHSFKLYIFRKQTHWISLHILRVKSFSFCQLHSSFFGAIRQCSKQSTNFHHFIFGDIFFSPISVPTHYRILSVPLPCLILIFPLVGFISFLSPLTLNSPTLKLHTNHSSFNTPLRLAGTILWKTSTVLEYNGQQSIQTCI